MDELSLLVSSSSSSFEHNVDDYPNDTLMEMDDDEFNNNSQNNESMGPRAGRIKEIRLQNFLVHQNIKIPFCLNCNVIVGSNGSGKSAIASSLAICLGGKGRTSGRQTAGLKDYVRVAPNEEEKSAAVVTVEFDNCGENSYEYEKFGDSITIERRIDVNGGSRFKLGGARASLKNSTKKAIDDYGDAASIDMENVTVYLNQDNAKKLLRSSSPHDFYRFFEQTLNVEEAAQNQSVAWAAVCSAEEHLEGARSKRDRETFLLREHEKKYEAYEQHVKLKEEEVRLKSLLYWKAFDAVAAEMNEMENEKNNVENEIDNINSRIVELKEELAALEQNERTRKLQLNQEIAVKDEERSELEGQLRNVLEPKRVEAKTILKGLKLDEDREQRNLRALLTRKEDTEKEMEIDIGPQEARKNVLKQQLKELETKESEIEREIESLEEQLISSQSESDEKERMKIDLDNAKEELKISKTRLVDIRRQRAPTSTTDIFRNRFGYDPNRVKELVRRDKRFSSPPVGPIADYVFANERLWTDKKKLKAIETYMTKYLPYWLVGNHNDRILLEGHLKNAGCRIPQIMVISNFTRPVPFNTSLKFQPTRNMEYVIDLLDVTDVNAKNFLIEKAFIEATALFNNFDDMYESLPDRSINLARGLECERCSFGIRYGGGAGVEIPPSDELRIGPNDHLIRRQQQMSEQEFMEQRAAEVQFLNQTIQTEESRVDEMGRELSRLQQKEGKLNNLLGRKKNELERLKADKDKSEDELVYTESEIRRGLEKKRLLETEGGERLKEIEQELKLQRVAVAEKHALVVKQLKVLEGCENSIHEMKTKIHELDEEIKELRQSSSNPSRPSQVAAIAQFDHDKHELSKQLTELIVAIEDKQEEYEDAEKRATPYDRPLEEDSSSSSASSTLDVIKEQLKDVLGQLSLSEDLTEEEAQALRAKVASSRRNTETCGNDVDRLEQDKETQKKYHTEISEKICDLIKTGERKAKAFFNRKMELISKLQARMEFDHEGKQIHFYTRGSKKPTDLSTLSGGERATVQSGLLMALAESSDSPFHIFDELDVFMDDETRHDVMQLLFEFARTNFHRQFIFITPHVEVCEFFKSERLKYPDFDVNIFKLG